MFLSLEVIVLLSQHGFWNSDRNRRRKPLRGRRQALSCIHHIHMVIFSEKIKTSKHMKYTYTSYSYFMNSSYTKLNINITTIYYKNQFEIE